MIGQLSSGKSAPCNWTFSFFYLFFSCLTGFSSSSSSSWNPWSLSNSFYAFALNAAIASSDGFFKISIFSFSWFIVWSISVAFTGGSKFNSWNLFNVSIPWFKDSLFASYGLIFFWLLGFFRLNLIHLTLFALNYLTSTLCFFLPSLLLSQIDIFSISLRLLLSSLVVIGIGSDIFTVLDHEFAQFDGLPVGVSVDKGLPFGLEFKFSLLFAFFSFLFLLDSFLSSFLSFFELFFFLSLSFGLFLFSSFILLFALSFVIDFFLDVLYVSQ